MKLSDIKEQLGLTSLALNVTTDPEWVSCFINEARISVLMPTELADALSDDNDIDLVLVPKGTRTSKKSKEEYTLFLVIEQKADYIL